MGLSVEFAARIRRERSLQLRADLDNGSGGGSGNGGGGGGGGGGDFLRNHSTKLANLVGFFVVQERVSHALPAMLPKDTLLAYFTEADTEVGARAQSSCELAKDPALLLAAYDGLTAACWALRGRGYTPAGLQAWACNRSRFGST